MWYALPVFFCLCIFLFFFKWWDCDSLNRLIETVIVVVAAAVQFVLYLQRANKYNYALIFSSSPFSFYKNELNRIWVTIYYVKDASEKQDIAVWNFYSRLIPLSGGFLTLHRSQIFAVNITHTHTHFRSFCIQLSTSKHFFY